MTAIQPRFHVPALGRIIRLFQVASNSARRVTGKAKERGIYAASMPDGNEILENFERTVYADLEAA